MRKKNLKVALIHDFLREYGGAERVVEALHEMFPDAPLYVAFLDKESLGIHWQNFADWDIRETWFARLPLAKKLYSPLRLFAPKAFADLDLSKYDLVISSSNAFEAKAVKAPNGVHVCYCHTPPRALYGYSTMSSWKKNPLIHFFGTLINHYMRVVDFKVAQKVDHFIANSEEVQRRIKKFYRRDSTVIYPPVNVNTDKASAKKGDYYLYVNRLGLQKHPELAVTACNQLKVSLKVVGTGQMESVLKEMAGFTIEFMGAVDDQTLNDLYAGAQALIYPVEDEDFGIVPVEAMGHGVPVIAHKSGGPMETVLEGETGIFFDELTADALVEAMKKADKIKFDRQAIIKHAQFFSKANFKKRLKAALAQWVK